MRGLSRVIVISVINFLVVYIVVALVLSIVYSTFAYRMLVEIVEESVRAYEQRLRYQPRGRTLSEEQIRMLVESYNKTLYIRFGLLDPPWVRALKLLYKLVTFRLNEIERRGSYSVPGTTALEISLNAMARSAIVFTTATIINFFIGLIFGIKIAQKHGSFWDRAMGTLAMMQSGIPLWWTAMVMLLLFAYIIPIFPSNLSEVEVKIMELNEQRRLGNISVFEYIGRYLWTWIYYMSLFIITLLVISFAGAIYSYRTIVLVISREDFVTVARAKGLPEKMVLYKHILRAASPPIVTGMVYAIIGSLGGALITERVFQWPGNGFVYWQALQQYDSGVLVVNTWVLTFLWIVAVFALDFVYMILDPRVRIGKGVEE